MTARDKSLCCVPLKTIPLPVQLVKNSCREFYTNPDGSLMKTGDIFKPPASLVQTLRAIADDGVSALHGGEVGRKLVQDIQDQGCRKKPS